MNNIYYYVISADKLVLAGTYYRCTSTAGTQFFISSSYLLV